MKWKTSYSGTNIVKIVQRLSKQVVTMVSNLLSFVLFIVKLKLNHFRCFDV